MQRDPSMCFRAILTLCLGTLLGANGHGADANATRQAAPPGEPGRSLAAPAAVPAAGADTSRATPPGGLQPGAPTTRATPPGMSRGIPGGLQNAPLAGEMRLSPGQLSGLGLRQTPMAIKFDLIEKQVAVFLNNATQYENAAQQIQKIRQLCAMKNYTVQDQKHAGCSGAETLDQCSSKLLAYCIKTTSGGGAAGLKNAAGIGAVQKGSSTSFGDAGQGTSNLGELAGQVSSMGGKGASGASPMQFQQSAQATASQARTLAQQLNQYASQVENSTQALLP